MTEIALAQPDTERWDPVFTAKIADRVYPVVRRYFRSEVRGMESMPRSAALVVSNHSGGMFTPDPLIFAADFYEKFGYDRPLYTLAHNTVLMGPLEESMLRAGVIHASRENARAALASGAVVLVFPGGDFDSYRPTSAANVIDFNGRTGYVETAIEAGVPIVPTVSIGAQQSQLFLTRGTVWRSALGSTTAAIEDPADQCRISVRGQRDPAAERAAATEIVVHDTSAESRHLVLPMRPPGTAELSETELAALVTRDGLIGTASV